MYRLVNNCVELNGANVFCILWSLPLLPPAITAVFGGRRHCIAFYESYLSTDVTEFSVLQGLRRQACIQCRGNRNSLCFTTSPRSQGSSFTNININVRAKKLRQLATRDIRSKQIRHMTERDVRNKQKTATSDIRRKQANQTSHKRNTAFLDHSGSDLDSDLTQIFHKSRNKCK
jgi:hypothetical protein